MKNEKNRELIIYKDKNKRIKVQLREETIWSNINQIAFLFEVQKATVSKHIKNIYNSKELRKSATVSKMETVQQEGSV